VKLRTFWSCVLLSTAIGACSFDRSPVSGKRQLFDPTLVWTGDFDGAGGKTARERLSRDGGSDEPKSQTGSKSDDRKAENREEPREEDGGVDEDAGVDDRKPTACNDQFCPLSDDPVSTCCTSQGDVDQHAARSVNACGQNLSKLDDAQYGAGCWQRDQLGIIDPRCPARGDEPGCCADDGMCGTSDPEHHLGCYHAKGAELRPCRSDSEPVGNVCDPRGSYALRITVDAAWNGRPGGLAALTDDGRGKIQIYLLVRVDDVDAASGELRTAGRVCGVTLPPFYSSTLCESYQPLFPETIWESPYLPSPNIGGRYECAADGCVMSVWPTTYLFGIRLGNSEDPWPTAQQTRYLRCPDREDENCFADDDVDGQPGITVLMATEGMAEPLGACRGYSIRGAPLSDSIGAIFGGVRRADRLNVGIRARVGGSVRFGADCASATGSAVVEYVNSRADGCRVQPGTYDLGGLAGPAGENDPCRPEEANFIDLSMPVYQVLGAGESPGAARGPRDDEPSDGPTVSIVRFAPGVVPGCLEARTAPF
jgi:hypothetical protein